MPECRNNPPPHCTGNLLEGAGGCLVPFYPISILFGCGGLVLSLAADVRSSDDGAEFEGQCTGTCGKAPIGGQISDAGFLLYESTRVNSIGYTTVELQNLFRLAQLSRAATAYFGVNPVEDLFAYTSSTGGQSSVRGALDFLVPFAVGDKNWTRATETTTWAIFRELRIAAAVFENTSYAAYAKRPHVLATGCLDVGVKNCSISDAVLWWPDQTNHTAH